MNYWIFKANPEHYRIDERLLDPNPEIIWAVTRFQERIQKGDTVFIWRTGTPRGVCAVMMIDAFPYQLAENELRDGYELPAAKAAPEPPQWAKGRFVQRFPVIESNVIKKIPGLELFSFFSAFQQATNFSITRPEGTILLEFVEKYQADPPAKKRQSVSKPARKANPTEPVRAGRAKKSNSVGGADGSAGISLLQCEECGTYVVSSDTERHIREVHSGQPVEWKKTK